MSSSQNQKRTVVETEAATITLIGAGSDSEESDESSSSVEENVQHSQFNQKRETLNEIKHSQLSGCSNNNVADSINNDICQSEVVTDKTEEDVLNCRLSHFGVHKEDVSHSRINPFDGDDLSDVCFEHASHDVSSESQEGRKADDCSLLDSPHKTCDKIVGRLALHASGGWGSQDYNEVTTHPEPPDPRWSRSSSSQQVPADQHHVTNAELGLAEDHFSQPEGSFGLSTLEELDLAIRSCQDLIFAASENTERRKSLVHKLVQLRLKKQEAKEDHTEEEDVKCVVGHKFTKTASKSSKRYCEKCAGVIWGVIQACYRCQACGFSCHDKCLNLITRTCASSKVAENPTYILSICPEKGLAEQMYRCAECRAPLAFRGGMAEPRQCDYTGQYYCELCHWNDSVVLPARILHNWDMEQYKVCRASKQFLRLMLRRPVLRINDVNPMLFNFVEELNDVKKLREEILVMKRYFLSCKQALNSKLLLQLSERQHFVDSSDMYSVQDLLDTANDVMLAELARIHASFAQHIKTDCQLCQAKGYICELCEEREVLFPFDNMAIVCSQCSAVYHRHCYMRRNRFCPKCARLSQRATHKEDIS